jgi:phosphatidylinositol alpha-1,6-mannosyltransferase
MWSCASSARHGIAARRKRSPGRLAALRAGARAQIMPNVPSPDGTDVEGFGIAAVEAAAAGAPVLAADLEGLSDAVKDGETGFLLLPADADAWTAKIMDVIAWDEDRRQTFAATARNCVMRHYSWRRVAEQTIGIYRDCLRQAGKAA